MPDDYYENQKKLDHINKNESGFLNPKTVKAFAFFIILFMMIIVFRSFRIGLLSMIVNIIPAILTFGIMGWLNIPLNLVTAMVPSIAMGIAVDDTIHLMWRFSKEIHVDGNYNEAILRSLRRIGKPIVTTSLAS